MKILIAEDDEKMRKILTLYLQKEGYSVASVCDGENALAYFETDYADLLILDWMMPGKDGIQVCQEIRQLNIPIKIILLTAKSTPANELHGLLTGADDYIKKPFEMEILLIRIKKLCRTNATLLCQDISLNTTSCEVMRNDEKLDLTKKEFDLLKYFLMNQNVVLSREQIINGVWGMDYFGDARTVDTHIQRLRKKLGGTYITTQFGTGYKMEAANE